MQIQQNPTPSEVSRAFQRIGGIVEGKIVGPYTVGTTETAVPHGLGRVPVAWFELSPAAGADRPGNTRAPDEAFLYLSAASAETVTLWVF